MTIDDLPVLTGQELHAQFSENSQEVLERRYLRKDESGRPVETIA